MAELRTSPPPVPAAPPPPPPAAFPAQPGPPPPPPAVPSAQPGQRPRSGLVTISGIVVAIVPPALLATAIAMMPDSAPAWSMFSRGDPRVIVSAFVFLAALALVTLAGIAIARRWPGWRVCSSIIGWSCIVLANYFVSFYLESLEPAPFLAPSGESRGLIVIAAALALLAILLLVGKRDEPPRHPARPMTAVGILIIAIGVAMFFAALIVAPVAAAIGGVIALAGVGIVMRGPGWRIYSGFIAWFLIVAGVGGFFTQMPSTYHPRWLVLLWMHLTTVAACIGTGWFILWSKRREPRSAPEEKDVPRPPPPLPRPPIGPGSSAQPAVTDPK